MWLRKVMRMTKEQAIAELTRAAEICPTTPQAKACRMAVETLQFKDVERLGAVPVKYGRWKAVKDGEDDYRRICSCCGEDAPYDESDDAYLIYPYCPWCGAEMYGEEGDNHD